jgi:adenine-specific DNA-methyltransferase
MTNYEKLLSKLTEMFQLDQADLDFGIYRIMNSKRDEIVRFLEKDLLPQVKEVLATAQGDIGTAGAQELKQAEDQARALGMNPDNIPKVKELRAKYDAGTDISALEQEVFNHLYSFFKRYYNDGDFLSLRKYKEGVYAIPYEGEEVKLHWANADQYYIKTAEHFRDFIFKVGEKRVHFKLVEAQAERENNKEQEKRVFILAQENPVVEIEGELIIRFEYRNDTGKRKQKDLTELAIATILNAAPPDWKSFLTTKAPTEKDTSRTILAKRLNDYTARNTFDYFIHKDLGGFLRRELDFYIKNEVMHLDDIENEAASKVEQYLAKVRAIRRVASKIIDFLAQLEDFQKALWLKKKFVVETRYLISVDRVPEHFYPLIVENTVQREEWVRLFAIDKSEGYTEPLTDSFLKANGKLILDTSLFPREFTRSVIAEFTQLDESLQGVLVHSDNFQALNLARSRFGESLKSIYIDPPYNTDSSSIPYKNNYKHSSFATMMRDRLAAAHPLLKRDGAIFVSIDKTERIIVEHALDSVFGSDNHIEELIWTQATSNGQLPNYSTNHEYVEVYARDRQAVEADKDMFREPKPGFSEIMELIAQMNPEYPSPSEVEEELQALFKRHKDEYREEVEAAGQEWDADAKRHDPWRGIYLYKNAEYRDASGTLVLAEDAKKLNAKLWIWREIPTGAPASKQSPTTKDENHPNYRFYKPIHPLTGLPCPHPQSGWKFPARADDDNADRRSFESLVSDNRIAWGEDEQKVPQSKGFLHEVETNIGTSVFYEYNDGEAELSNLFGSSGLFLSPKSSKFVRKFIIQSTKSDSWFADFFAGTGSSAHGLIRANREDGGSRKFLIVEVGRYFDSLTKPRILKALYASDWKGGTPRSQDGISAFLKLVRLESYEDALANLEVRNLDTNQAQLIESNSTVREDYMLRYVMNAETAASQSRMNLKGFDHPFEYKLKVATDTISETKNINVDLLETFNWLLGLRVHTMDVIRGFHVVTGRLPGQGNNERGEMALIIWRDTTENPNQKLDDFFGKQAYNTQDQEFDVIYVNGDNNLQNLRKDDQTWKVRLIEEEFHRLMWNVEGI